MDDVIEGYPVFTIEYGRSGKAKDSAHADKLHKFAKDNALDDLLVMSHGWNNSAKQAERLYTGLLEHLKNSQADEPKLQSRKIGVLAVIWPSKRFKAFEQDDSPQAGGAASAEPVIGNPMDDAKDLVKELDEELTADQQQELLSAAKAAIENADNWPAFLDTLEKLVPKDDEAVDEADALLFGGIKNPQEALTQFDFIEVDDADDMQAGGAAGGLFETAAGAVGSVLNFTTFYLMKRRAGKVGQSGVAHSLVGIRVACPDLRIHLVGHSFGARVVTMAAHALNGQSSAAPDSMTLLQAAFSHNSFSANFPPDNKPGFFRNVISKDCVKGPILISHTFNDIPVRVAYSIASALSGDNASFTNSEPSQYGGLGANGAQFMGDEAEDGKLLEKGADGYAFTKDMVYNLNSDDYIKGHSDIRVPQVGYAIAKAMVSTL